MPGIGVDGAKPATAELLTAASVDDPVDVIDQPAPRYPAALEQAGIIGRVELEYVVDTTGRAEPGSLRTLLTTHPAFEGPRRTSQSWPAATDPRVCGGEWCVNSSARDSTFG
jgi:hypothetical protein